MSIRVVTTYTVTVSSESKTARLKLIQLLEERGLEYHKSHDDRCFKLTVGQICSRDYAERLEADLHRAILADALERTDGC